LSGPARLDNFFHLDKPDNTFFLKAKTWQTDEETVVDPMVVGLAYLDEYIRKMLAREWEGTWHLRKFVFNV